MPKGGVTSGPFTSIGNAMLYESTAAQARQMREAMESRAVIDQAIGVIIAERRCNPQAAFEWLRGRSNTSNRKMRDVASTLVAEAQQSGES